MTKKNINDFLNGCIIGNYSNVLLNTKDFEISIQKYNKGMCDPSYYHKETLTYTVVLEGVIKFHKSIYYKDDIIEIVEWETVSFECLEDATLLIIKIPSIIGDKTYAY